jgi:hypothetical protein
MLGFERRAGRPERPVARHEDTTAAVLAAIDEALAFVSARELMLADDAMTVVDILGGVRADPTRAAALSSGVEPLRAWIAERALVSSIELADQLLDVRLVVASTQSPTAARAVEPVVVG